MPDKTMAHHLATLVAQARDLFERGRTIANSAEVTEWILNATDTTARWLERDTRKEDGLTNEEFDVILKVLRKHRETIEQARRNVVYSWPHNKEAIMLSTAIVEIDEVLRTLLLKQYL